EVDQAVELLVLRPKWIDEQECWKRLTELAGKLIDQEQKTFGGSPMPERDGIASDCLPVGDFGRYMKNARPIFLKTRMVEVNQLKPQATGYAVRGEEITIDTVDASTAGFLLMASAGAVRAPSVGHSVIFANGPVEVDHIIGSVIVCDGDFTTRRGIHSSLVIA